MMHQLFNNIRLFNKKLLNQNLRRVKVHQKKALHLKRVRNLNLHPKKAQDQEQAKNLKKAANLQRNHLLNLHLKNPHLNLHLKNLAAIQERVLSVKQMLLKLLKINFGKNQELLKKIQLLLENT